MSCHCDGRSKPWHRHSVFYTALLLLESIRPRFSSDFLVTCLDFSLLLLTELNQLFRVYSAQANRTKYISLGKDRQSKNIRTRCIAWLRRHKKMSGGSLDRWPTRPSALNPPQCAIFSPKQNFASFLRPCIAAALSSTLNNRLMCLN